MTNYIQPGDVMQYANAGSAISSGDIVVVGDQCGIAVTDIAATSGVGSLAMSGVYQCPKDGDEAFSQGDYLYYDSADGTLTKTATGNTPFGIAFEAAAEAAVVCIAKLMPHPNQVAVEAAVATADGSDAATTQALANALKAAHNSLLVKLKAAGIMENA
jgi:predicted RecA/RadA family phage recombinase